ncbi:unnamed protein product [Litomosoides sigmodontis]|uniref:Uncharacterized protein n=1 Tax=Litomosoides sigmodontis TaxID=42156 RepID=A0A3P6TBW9_LITSI|nr:unnamed protein product [Litomosoides sigmodontis]
MIKEGKRNQEIQSIRVTYDANENWRIWVMPEEIVSLNELMKLEVGRISRLFEMEVEGCNSTDATGELSPSPSPSSPSSSSPSSSSSSSLSSSSSSSSAHAPS